MNGTTKGFLLNGQGLLVAPELRDSFVLEVRWTSAVRGRPDEPRPDLIVQIEARGGVRHRFRFENVESASVRDFGLQNIVYEVLVLRDHQIQDEDLHCLIEGFDDDAYSATRLADLRGKIAQEQMVLVVFVPSNGAKLSVLCKHVEVDPA